MHPIIKISFILLLIELSYAQNFIEDRRFGTPEAGSDAGQFRLPQAISISQNKIIYVVDTGNNRIQLFDLNGNFIKSIGGFGFTSDKFDRPTDIWVRSIINIYVSDYNNRRTQRYDRNMNYISTLTSNNAFDTQFQFYEVISCAINSQQDLFLLDCGENKIIKFNRNGQPERSFGDYESGDGQLIQPVQIDIIPEKYLIISDVDHKALMVYDFFGNYIRQIISDQWVAPSGLTITDRGEVLMADPQAKKIFFISADFTTVKEIGVAMQTPLHKPQDLALFSFKSDGEKISKLYIIDNNNIIIGNFINP